MSNTLPGTPHGYRAGSPALAHSFEFYRKEAGKLTHCSVMIPTGASHLPEMQAFYEEALGSTRSFKQIALRHRHVGAHAFCLVDRQNQIAGGGEFDAHETPEDMATLICLLMEMLDCRVALDVPEDCVSESSSWAKDKGVFALIAQEKTEVQA